jgi:hypothetical protein
MRTLSNFLASLPGIRPIKARRLILDGDVLSILPAIAAFDSAHQREMPHITPFQLAHFFIPLPA